MKKYISILLLSLAFVWGCDDKAFLDREPTNILIDDQVWTDKSLILSVVADLYDRIPEYQTIENWWNYADFDEGFGSANGDYWRSKNNDWGYGEWSLWNYNYIREINLFIQKAESDLTNSLAPADKARFIAEGRFLRATAYFELVKRMGGVPLILEPLTYDFSGDPSYLQYPRAKESEVYDFILSELDAIKKDLPNDVNIKGRATQGLILAMESRVALYAGSIAKYGANTPNVTLSGGEVGIPANMATSYYQKALSAAEELINSGTYALYQKKENLSENFASLFIDKNANPEVIFVKDFKLQSGKVEPFTLQNQPWSGAEDLEGGRLNPSLNLVQSFEKLDNTFETFQTNTADGNFIYYDNPSDIFAGRDARLAGTVMIPGSKYKGKDLDIWAGYMQADGAIITGDTYGARKELPNGEVAQVVGFDGPIDGLEFTAQTGFYVRKFMDTAAGSGQRGLNSEVWWVRYRLAEVYLNAAEAAFELGQPEKAATYMDVVRRRAGFKTDLTAADMTFDRIVHERKVELAFEGHELWDMKRWRLAHIVWNGESLPLTTKPWKADEVSNRVFGLWPYKYYAPGDPNDGKYVYVQHLPAQVTGADRFRLGNYYSKISDEILNNNPQIVRNPNQN
ncbi:RagB/SusD family nutrient uptake outer membrane protein [Prolixibacter sp. NT017]|uniref:RagB/SusD family nutrient uptake outer membrane protein n=1 Tax=Prolixibacter sp. NT017 TaxID=2652390 RepID=UPI0012706C40|nr:RagB/SusD family nutrient uptake outer membrane protein [Prolixibacter sp. NT017]GET23981.1 membrane protein [Prolixibacter sp. NT017]